MKIYSRWFWVLVLVIALGGVATGKAEDRYRVSPVCTNLSLLAQNFTNAVATNISLVSSAPVPLSAYNNGKIAWSASLADGFNQTNVYFTALFSVGRSGPWSARQQITNTFAGAGVTTNTLQIVTVPEQARWMWVTNATLALTNNGTATIDVGQFCE